MGPEQSKSTEEQRNSFHGTYEKLEAHDSTKHAEKAEKKENKLSLFELMSKVIDSVGVSGATMGFFFFLTPLVQMYINYKEIKIADSIKDEVSQKLKNIAQVALGFYTASFAAGCAITGMFIYHLATVSSMAQTLEPLATTALALSSLFVANAAVSVGIALARMFVIHRRINAINNNVSSHEENRKNYQQLLKDHIQLHEDKHAVLTKIKTLNEQKGDTTTLHEELKTIDKKLVEEKQKIDTSKSYYDDDSKKDQHKENKFNLAILKKKFESNKLAAFFMTIVLVLSIAALASNPIGLSILGFVALAVSATYVGVKAYNAYYEKQNKEKIEKTQNVLEQKEEQAMKDQDKDTKKLEDNLSESMKNSEKLSSTLTKSTPHNQETDTFENQEDNSNRLTLHE